MSREIILKKLSIPMCPLRLNRDYADIKSSITTMEMATDKKDLKLSHAWVKTSRERNHRSQMMLKETEEKEYEDFEVEKVQTVKKLVKISPGNKDENVKSEDSSFEEEDDTAEDFDIEEKQEKEDSSSEDEKVKREDSSSEKDLSSYEEMIQKNREEKMAFLQSLQIDQAKNDLFQALCDIKKPRPFKRICREKEGPPVLRKSRRLAKLTIDFSEKALFSNATKASIHTEEQKKDLKTCSHVFRRKRAVRGLLQTPYDGPYPVVRRKDNQFQLSVKRRLVWISINRLKPAFLVSDSWSDATSTTLLPVTMSRYGRRVTFKLDPRQLK